MPNTALLIKNPLAATHEFKQACQLCYPKTGPRAGDYTYREGLEHKCKRDILLGRLRSSEDQTWKRIRPRPTKTSFVGSYYLCKDMINKQDCKYGDNCTFAYHQEEIDVWTEERKGTLNRDLLFDPLGGVKRGSLTIAKLLKEHQGIFTFLCEICFDSKPRIISKGTKDSPAVCSNLAAKHSFYNNKCLVHIVRSTSLKYCKVRQFQEHFQFDVCRHEVRYGCLREDSCHFAHSFIELKVWLLQQYSGMTHEDIVQESKKYWQQMEAHAGKASSSLGAPRTHGPGTFDLQMKFVCGQCWRNGQVVEPDKDLKYCSAKARHCWTKERRVLLVMSKAKRKWVSVRPLPSIRNFPQQYDLCIHAQNGRKCQYVGNCSFAHSPEERDMWTFMKENKILDMQQTYDMWLKKHNPGKPGEGTPIGSREGEKQIQMPTDYADIMMGYHCWLCGKNSNSKKQWQQHIQSEKHKEKVFTSDSDASGWAYRFPMGEFRLCDRCWGRTGPWAGLRSWRPACSGSAGPGVSHKGWDGQNQLLLDVGVGLMCLDKNCAVGAKVVKKAAPDEKVGVMCLEDGKPSIVEYYELTDELMNAKDESGEPAYNFGVILNYLFREKDLEDIMRKNMPLHIVEKKIPYMDENANLVKPETPNGYKFETLVLDMIHLMDSCLPFEVVREKEFAPIKNKTGVDSVESARELLKKNGVEL